MKTIGKYIGAILITGMLISSANVVVAQKNVDKEKKECCMDKGDKDCKMCKMLDLTDAQKEAAKKIKLESDKQVLPLEAKLKELEAKKQSLMVSPTVNKIAAEASVKEISAVKEQINLIRTNQKIEFRKILTEEQRVKFDMKPGMKKNHKDMMKKGKDACCK